MFDEKKLEAFLKSLELDTHWRKVVTPRHGVYRPVANPALELKMDKYDIFKQDDYENASTSEFPVLAKKGLLGFQFGFPLNGYLWPTYGGIQRAPFATNGFPADASPVENSYDKLKGNIRKLKSVPAAKIADPNPKPPTPERSPDYVHTITAWRAWDVEDGLLAALGTDFNWPTKHAPKARCTQNAHAAPQMECGCGYWSFKSLDLLTRVINQYATNVKAIGTVEIWGSVIECKNGWRSEYAYPKELWLVEPGLEHLSWDYGVPVKQL